MIDYDSVEKQLYFLTRKKTQIRREHPHVHSWFSFYVAGRLFCVRRPIAYDEVEAQKVRSSRWPYSSSSP